MITFDQTLDAVERVNGLLKSVDDLEYQFVYASANLSDFSNMLRYAHKKDFKDADDALQYIDQVLQPRLTGIIQAFESGAEEHFKKLKTASEHAERLRSSLELVTGASGDTLPG
jgi:predicted nucleic acid-binding protein